MNIEQEYKRFSAAFEVSEKMYLCTRTGTIGISPGAFARGLVFDSEEHRALSLLSSQLNLAWCGWKKCAAAQPRELLERVVTLAKGSVVDELREWMEQNP